MKITLIRHGQTKGNLEKRYIGTTDEPLTLEGIHQLQSYQKRGIYTAVELLYTSPLRRCVDTAKLLYPQQQAVLLPELRETDFGCFENKNYEELQENPNYKRWIESEGKGIFSGGEDRKDFLSRCLVGYHQVRERLMEEKRESAGVICHGGVIMGILSQIGQGDFYRWQVATGEGFHLFLDKQGKLTRVERIKEQSE